MTKDDRQPDDPGRDDAEREPPAKDAPTTLVEDGDSVSNPDDDTEDTKQ